MHWTLLHLSSLRISFPQVLPPPQKHDLMNKLGGLKRVCVKEETERMRLLNAGSDKKRGKLSVVRVTVI